MVGQYDVLVELTGVPCDFARIAIEGVLVDDEDVQLVTNALQQLGPFLVASEQDTNCDYHDHSGEE